MSVLTRLYWSARVLKLPVKIQKTLFWFFISYVTNLRKKSLFRSSHRWFSVKKVLLEISQNSQEKQIPLVVLYTLGNRFIMFLMWMVISLSSATSLSRFKFGLLKLFGELFLGFDLFCFAAFYYRTLQNIQKRQQ